MTIEEQKKIAYDMGRLSAWKGDIQQPRLLIREPKLLSEWSAGFYSQSKEMSDAAAEIPLVFSDEKGC